MPLAIDLVLIDCVDLDAMTAFWCQALDQTEVRRLEGLGARRIDIGQTDVPWVVMADPEGNEFCVLRSLGDKEHDRLLHGDR